MLFHVWGRLIGFQVESPTSTCSAPPTSALLNRHASFRSMSWRFEGGGRKPSGGRRLWRGCRPLRPCGSAVARSGWRASHAPIPVRVPVSAVTKVKKDRRFTITLHSTDHLCETLENRGSSRVHVRHGLRARHAGLPE